MKALFPAIAAAVLAWGPMAFAEDASHQHAHGAAAPKAGEGYTAGEVKKIDKEAGKITLKHAAIENLGMPPMTMVFRARDAASLDKVKVGDKVQFKVERVDGALTVTELRPGS